MHLLEVAMIAAAIVPAVPALLDVYRARRQRGQR